MRATTAFNRMLDLDGVNVTAITFTPDGIVVDLARRFRLLTCHRCAATTAASYDRRQRRWWTSSAAADRRSTADGNSKKHYVISTGSKILPRLGHGSSGRLAGVGVPLTHPRVRQALPHRARRA